MCKTEQLHAITLELQGKGGLIVMGGNLSNPLTASFGTAGVTDKHFKEKLPRVLGLGNSVPDAAAMTTGVRGLMFGDYMVPATAT